MTQPERICIVGCCSDDDCPNHGEYEEKEWDKRGLHPRYPYCCAMNKRLPESPFDFPEWCPLPHSNATGRDKVLDELYPPNTRIEKNGDLYDGWEIDPKSLIRLKKYIQSNPQYEEEPDMEVIEVVIRAIKHELKYGKVELHTAKDGE